MAIEIQLNRDVNITVVTREEVTLITNKISVDYVIDDGKSVKVRISFFSPTGMSKELTLWEDIDYINIGNWTDLDVENRIKELLSLN